MQIDTGARWGVDLEGRGGRGILGRGGGGDTSICTLNSSMWVLTGVLCGF